MRISKHGHSCILLEKEGKRILIDPGDYAFASKTVSPENFTGIGAVLVTHSHSDHGDPDAIKIILRNNPNALVYGNEETQRALSEQGVPVQAVAEEFETEGFHIRSIAAEHGKGVLGGVPNNTAFLVDGKFLHPGDSIDPVLDQCSGVAVLALPVIAPWDVRYDMAQFACRLRPHIVIPVHDGFIKEFFEEKQNEAYKNFLNKQGTEIEYKALKIGEIPGPALISTGVDNVDGFEYTVLRILNLWKKPIRHSNPKQ